MIPCKRLLYKVLGNLARLKGSSYVCQSGIYILLSALVLVFTQTSFLSDDLKKCHTVLNGNKLSEVE